MEMTETLQTMLDKLNAEQRQAVEHTNGPLLVVAGPGTGKTQLLSLRAANILIKCDAAPSNILCLTYTDAGAEAMRNRLVELIGRDGYGIQVSTFHGFASSMRALHPEYFDRAASDQLITPLRQSEIMDDLLKRLPFGSPLSSRGKDGLAYHTRDMLGFVSKVKRSGVSYETLASIAKQNIEAAEWLETHSALCEIAASRANARIAERFEKEIESAYANMPDKLKRPAVDTPGVYIPFARHLRDTVRRTELVNDEGRTSGFTELRNIFFCGSNAAGRFFSTKDASAKLLRACEVAEEYQKALNDYCLYDYDDMIFDFVRAVESNGSFRQALQDTYTYIQVDEFQDTNGAQMRIIELLCDDIDNPNVMVVGDDDQAIMRFQGASIECINQFIDRYHPRNIVLKTNYRSTPAVVDLGQTIACQIERRLAASEDKTIEAFHPQGDQNEFVETVFASKAEEYAALAKSIRARIDVGYVDTCDDPDKAIAVISPKHAVLRALIPYLVAENVPFSYRQTQNLFKSERMQTTLAVIHCVSALATGQERLAISYLPQIICSPEFGGDHASSVRLALQARREHRGNWLRAMKDASDSRIRKLYENLMDWAAKANSAPVRELLFEIAERPLAYYRALRESNPFAAAEFNAGMRALLDFVAGELGDSIRFTNVVEQLDKAHRHDISIEAGINLHTRGAVRLTSSHSSKGLEFDCVYLVDADDATWHRGAATASLYPSNLLIGDEKDEDDARRLLFVAVTRAKRHLELYRANGSTVRELSDEVKTSKVEADPQFLDKAIETEWRNNYRLDTPELIALLDTRNDMQHLSASALNAFVTYEEDCENSLTFPEQQLIRLPQAPQIQLEFGTVVHAMMQDIVNLAMEAKNKSLEQITAAYRKKVQEMDFPQTDIILYSQRFERICTSFIPWLVKNVGKYRRIAEAQIEALTDAGTPLLGFLDLLLVDDEAGTVRIVDYKTGFGYEVSDGYERQLKFYKLLVELSPQFEGYTVVSMGDFYVEPEKGSGELHPPLEVTATQEEIRGLERLVDAVWARIQAGAWDTSAFNQSKLYATACAEQDLQRSKKDKARVMQRAYERWLVDGSATDLASRKV